METKQCPSFHRQMQYTTIRLSITIKMWSESLTVSSKTHRPCGWIFLKMWDRLSSWDWVFYVFTAHYMRGCWLYSTWEKEPKGTLETFFKFEREELETPADLDTTVKLIILPNYLLADLYLPLPSTIKDTYRDSVGGFLSFPVASVPGLYNLLSTTHVVAAFLCIQSSQPNTKVSTPHFNKDSADEIFRGPDNSQVTDLFYAADFDQTSITGTRYCKIPVCRFVHCGIYCCLGSVFLSIPKRIRKIS